MKLLLFIGVVAVGIFVILFTMAANPLQTEFANITLNQSDPYVANMDGWTEVIRFWPVFPIVVISGMVLYALWKVIKAVKIS